MLTAVLGGGGDHAGGLSASARIVFANGGRIFSIEADGASRTQLTGGKVASHYGQVKDGGPVWSPDRSLIAFVRGSKGSSRIMLLSTAGGAVRGLTRSRSGVQELDPAWSPDGRQLAFSRFTEGSPSTSIVVINRDGSGEHEVVTERFGPNARNFYFVSQPAWAPDGSHIAYTRTFLDRDSYFRPSLYLANVDGTGSRLLRRNASSAAFSPDGSAIAFASIRDRNGSSCGEDECSYEGELYVMDADGSDPRRLTHNKGDDNEPDWSASGDRIVFSSNRNRPERFGHQELYSVRPDGTFLTWLTNGAPESVSPDWEPEPTALTDPGGCGATARRPLVDTDTGPLKVDRGFPTYWLGSSFRGLLLDAAEADLEGGVFAIYSDCGRYDPRECPEDVQLLEAPVCGGQRAIVAEAGLAKRYLKRRGALLADFRHDRGLGVYTGGADITIYGGPVEVGPLRSPAFPAEMRIFRGLRPFGREKSQLLPRAAFPRSLLRELHRVRASYERRGSVRAVAKALRMRPATVRKKLRLERVIRRLGPVRRVPC